MNKLPSFTRLREVAGVLFDYELHHLIKACELKMHLPFHKRFEPEHNSFDTQPETIRKIFEKLGGAFIKLGQILALRPDLIGRDYSKEFEKLLTDVEPEDILTIKSLIKGIPFSSFTPKPLGSASIAQVHKAILNGKTVAVKIKRPNVDRKFAEDIKIMEYLAVKIKEKYNPSYVDPVDIVEEFKKYTEKELDFEHEASNIRKFARNFSSCKDIIIPRVYEKYSTKNILIMEFEDGKNILESRNMKKLPKNIIKKVTDAVYKMLFEDRFFHADLHPGNIYFIKDKIIFLDFGIVGHIDEALERKLFRLFSALINGSIEKTADALLEINISNEEPDAQYLKDGLYNVLGDYYNQPLGKMNFPNIFYGAIEVARKSRIKMPAQLVLFGKSLATMEGFCRQVDPEFNIVVNAKPYVDKFISKKLSPRNFLGKAKDAAFQIHDLLAGIPETTRSMARKFSLVEERIIDIDMTFRTLIRVVWKSGKLLSLSLLLMTFMITSLMLINKQPAYYGYSLVSITGFAICVLFLVEILRLLLKEP